MRQALLYVKVSKLAAVARASEWYIQILARLLILICWTWRCLEYVSGIGRRYLLNGVSLDRSILASSCSIKALHSRANLREERHGTTIFSHSRCTLRHEIGASPILDVRGVRLIAMRRVLGVVWTVGSSDTRDSVLCKLTYRIKVRYRIAVSLSCEERVLCTTISATYQDDLESLGLHWCPIRWDPWSWIGRCPRPHCFVPPILDCCQTSYCISFI